MMLKRSKIILALLDTGEVYLVDRRKEYRSRVELVEEVVDSRSCRSSYKNV